MIIAYIFILYSDGNVKNRVKNGRIWQKGIREAGYPASEMP
jgi:hypothetical protein